VLWVEMEPYDYKEMAILGTIESNEFWRT
jgi:hypothetical protein